MTGPPLGPLGALNLFSCIEAPRIRKPKAEWGRLKQNPITVNKEYTISRIQGANLVGVDTVWDFLKRQNCGIVPQQNTHQTAAEGKSNCGRIQIKRGLNQ